MNTNGFIQLSREFLRWQWYDDDPAMRLFLHLLLTANYAPAKWHGITVERGQRAASLAILSEETGIPRTTLFRTLKKLEKSGDVEQQKNSSFTVITVKNYDSYTTGGTETEQDRNTYGTGTEQKRNYNYYNKNNKYNKNNNYNKSRSTDSYCSIDVEALENSVYERYRKAALQNRENS